MDAWEELAKEYYERNYPKSKFVSLKQEEKKEFIKRVKAKVVHRLNILTDAYFGEERFRPISNRLEELNAEQKKKFQDDYRKCMMKMVELEKQICKRQKELERLEQEMNLGKVTDVIITDRIKKLKHDQDKEKRQYDEWEGRALNALTGTEEKRRFEKLNDSERELFEILLREITQDDLEKMRHNRWEEFPLEMRKRIAELLDELCTEEQWRPVATGMEINMDIIEYKLLHPREYRLFLVTEMMMRDEISRETKDDVLEMIDKKIFKAYIELSKAICDIADEVGKEELEKQMDEGIKRHLQ